MAIDPTYRKRVYEELEWHCDDPVKVAAVMTEEELTDVVKRGFVSKGLWERIEKRLAALDQQG